MPELPEVETVARGLKHLEGLQLERLENHDPKVWFESELGPQRFNGKILKKISRRGKYIIYDFDGLYLVQHLRMTGKMLPGDSSHLPDDPKKKLQRRSTFHFPNTRIVFFDPRRFGTLTATRNLEHFFTQKKIAPDPLHATSSAWRHYQSAMRETKRSIKSALLDQSIMAGVGNIYADESLFLTNTHPLTPANKVKYPGALFEAHVLLFQFAILRKGTTIMSYRGADGAEGGYAKELKVYGRAGQLCVECGKAKIKKLIVAGRTTCFCPRCQKRR